MRHTLTQEEYLTEEFRLLGVKPHITHLKQPDDCYYNVVTVATSTPHDYLRLSMVLSGCYLEGRVTKRSDLGTLILDRFAEFGFGVALCHHLDQFSRERGRIISEGRLLKLLRAERRRRRLYTPEAPQCI